MIAAWKRSLLDGAPDIFDKNQKAQKQTEKQINELYKKIGQLQVEHDFLSKKLSL
jgi:transposase